MGPDAIILVIWMLSFKPAFSLFSFTFINWCFSSSLLLSIRVASSACLRLLIFLQKSWFQQVTIYSLDILLSHFWIRSFLNTHICCFLTCLQISQETDKVVWYSHLFKNFSQFAVIHTVKGFSVVNKAEVDVFLELPCFFDDPADVGNLISGSSAFSKSSLNIWKFTVHVLLKPGLENFEHYFTSVWVSAIVR